MTIPRVLLPSGCECAARADRKEAIMPWRKYTPRKGKHGPIYQIVKGVQVRRHANGRWQLHVERDGQRSKRSLGQGREGLANAIKAAEMIASQMSKAVTMAPQEKPSIRKETPFFLEYAERWLEENQGRWTEWTIERYEQILRLYIRPERLFQNRLHRIKRSQIKRFLRGIAARRSPATVEAIHGVVSGIFNEAIDDELVDSNPAASLLKSILPLKNKRDIKQAEPFNMKERDRFLARAEQIASPSEVMLLKVMAFAGLRLGEALALRCEYFNPENRTYFVTQGFKRYRFTLPKGGKSRVVDLPDFLTDDLEVHVRWLRKESLRAGRGGLVDLLFPDPGEGYRWPFSQRKAQMLVKRVCKAAGLAPRNPHDLRHTYATILLMAHESPGYVQRQLGHSSIAITMDIYCHWIPGEGRKNLERALLGPSKGKGAVVRKSRQIAPNTKATPVTTWNRL